MTVKLTVAKRDVALKAAAARANGLVPAIVYGPKQEPIEITIDQKAFDLVRSEAGESTIITLEGLDAPVEVLIKEVDFSPVRQQVLHADFYAIERGKDITTHVPLEFTGESPAEDNNIGTVTKVLHEVEVTCRPSKLPAEIVVDIAALVDEDSKITIADLPQLEGVVYEHESEETVAVVSVAKEEIDEDPEAVDMDAIATEEKGKKESEEEAA